MRAWTGPPVAAAARRERAAPSIRQQRTADRRPTYTAPSSLPPTNPLTITAISHAYNLNSTLVANAATASTTITAPASIAFTEQPPTNRRRNRTGDGQRVGYQRHNSRRRYLVGCV